MAPLTQRALEPTKAAFPTIQWEQEVESAAAPEGRGSVNHFHFPWLVAPLILVVAETRADVPCAAIGDHTRRISCRVCPDTEMKLESETT